MNAFQRFLGKHSDIALVLMVLGVLIVLFAPIPAGLLDFLILGNFGFAFLILLLSAVLGVVTVVAAVMAWRSGNRLAIRIGAAALIVNAVTSLPAFFVDISAWIKLVSAVTILLTVVAVVLMLRRESGPVAITD